MRDPIHPDARWALRTLFRVQNRQLKDLGPVRGAQRPLRAPLEMSPGEITAMACAMKHLDAALVRIERRYGDLPAGVTPITARHDPARPCDQCGSTRTARAPYGLGGDTVWILCNNADACMGRLRKLKAQEEGEAA